jgi:Protein of unknown function (DUF3276)
VCASSAPLPAAGVPRYSHEQEAGMGTRGEVFSSKADTPKRTYFFNVKENRTGDLFLTIVESKKGEGDQFERRTVMVFKEDLSSFVAAFDAAVKFIKAG